MQTIIEWAVDGNKYRIVETVDGSESHIEHYIADETRWQPGVQKNQPCGIGGDTARQLAAESRMWTGGLT